MKITKNKYSGPTKVVGIRLSINLIEKLNYICRKTNRSRKEVLSMCIDKLEVEEGDTKDVF